MKQPLVSVIIPTHTRPKFLPRAINSALISAPQGSIEVVVVPNGMDNSWHQAKLAFSDDARVKWHPIPDANVNAARNHGLDLSQGKYVRFLDDDDYLYPECVNQCALLESSECDVSQGGIDLIDSHGRVFDSRRTNPTDDFLLAIIAPTFFTLCHSLLWRRAVVAKQRWDETDQFGHDYAFALKAARDKEPSVQQCALQVGAWIHHSDQRISTRLSCLAHARAQVESLLDTIRGLEERSALNASRRKWISSSLWQLIHSHFYLAPIYWSKVANISLALSPDSRPDAPAFRRFPLTHAPVLAVEWMLMPHRFVRHRTREYFGKPLRHGIPS